MENISVSIVVPVCNVENYLKECMDSILNQSLQNIEIICVDDGSTDHSLSILRSYEKKDKKSKSYHKSKFRIWKYYECRNGTGKRKIYRNC